MHIGRGKGGNMNSDDFFQSKKPWSPYKDMILDYYLKPYLTKVCSLGKSVVVFDCFAGPGRFEDGTDGSPLIIAKAIRQVTDKGKTVSAILIEEKKKYFKLLQATVKDYQDICHTKNERFEDSANEIANIGRNSTVFVYIDPYGIKPLRFEILAGIYANIDKGSSVEVLLNFNASSLVRNGLAALKYDQQYENEEELDKSMTLKDIDAIAGGDYWRDIVTSDISFAEKEAQCVVAYMDLMKKYFDKVCFYSIKEKYEHIIPKYRLLFGSRHEDAFMLMNDAICNARDKFLGKQCIDGYLFDMRAKDEIHDPQRLQYAIVDSLTKSMTRKKLISCAMHKVFAEYKESEYKHMIGDLINDKKILSESGKTRINDKEVLSPNMSFNGRKQ
jgi:three-Cys-motif partner protein